MKLEANGKNSCTGNSRHVDITHFWVMERVDKKEVEIKYFQKTLMLMDCFTKPLKGNVFKRLRLIMMGQMNIKDLLLDPNFLLKDHVGKINRILIKK